MRIDFHDLAIQIFLSSFFAKNNKARAKRGQRTQNFFLNQLENAGDRELKKIFCSEMATEQKFWLK